MKYIPINEFVNIGNEIYKCVEVVGDIVGSCDTCDFESYGKPCMNASCNAADRFDMIEVKFILYDNTSEDNHE